MNGPGESVEDLERILCADGCCIGIINEKGVCNICGRKSSARGRVQEETPIVAGSEFVLFYPYWNFIYGFWLASLTDIAVIDQINSITDRLENSNFRGPQK